MFSDAYQGRRVFVTGHTGFKGSWLCEWLLQLGAEVAGYSLAPPTTPALFDRLGLADRLQHQLGDVRDSAAVADSIHRFAPHIVFHLAAQPIVRASYVQPLDTFDINVMGTAHVLDALRTLQTPCAGVMVTTDKCYENIERDHPYIETDRLGGHDPYSASKAAAELIVASYRKSFFPDSAPVAIASVRAGNVIGGGDWALDRIVPDSVRSLENGRAISVRNPQSTRPWQHVLEPLSGYLVLGSRLLAPANQHLRSAFNFGPAEESTRTVRQLVEQLLAHMPGTWRDDSDPTAHHEARLLKLSFAKATELLQWRPVWSFEECIRHTAEWYLAPETDALSITRQQIATYTRAATTRGLRWANLNG